MSSQHLDDIEDAETSESDFDPSEGFLSLAEIRNTVLAQQGLLDSRSSIPTFVYPVLSQSTIEAQRQPSVGVWPGQTLNVPSPNDFRCGSPERDAMEGICLEDIAPREPISEPVTETKNIEIAYFTAKSGEVIKRGDCAYVANIDDADNWIGRVENIYEDRETSASTATPQIWVEIHWFYTKDHIADLLKQRRTSPKTSFFDFRRFSRFELIETPDHQEVYPSEFFERYAMVYQVPEAPGADIRLLPPIPDGEWFCRTTFLFTTPKTNRTPTYPINTCICNAKRETKGKGRAKKDKRPVHIRNSRFCPRSACLRWFHEECLEKWTLPPDENADRGALLAATLPDDLDLSPLQVFKSDEDGQQPNPADLSIVVTRLLPLLPGIAGLPIVRTPDQAYGNVRAICLARVLLHAVRVYDQELLEAINWDKIEEGGFLNISGQPIDSPSHATCFECPLCRHTI